MMNYRFIGCICEIEWGVNELQKIISRTVSGVELPISANTQINTSELLLASRTSYIKEVKQGPAQAETSVRFIAALPDTRELSSSRYAIFSEPILSKTIISQQKILCYIHAQDGKKSNYFSV